MGSGLREYKRKKRGLKLADGLSVGGKGRLVDRLIDKIQNYYVEAIRNHANDLDGMVNAIWAIYKHIIVDDSQSLEEQHSLCPKDNTTWCSYWKHPGTYDSSKRLTCVFLDVLKPLFTNLSNSSLLSRCLAGHTQNQNEAINRLLWRFCGIEKLRYAVSETVCHFNIGSWSRVELMKNIGVNPSANMKFTMLAWKLVKGRVNEKCWCESIN